MSLPASAIERKKAEANENTFVVRPPIRQRFECGCCGLAKARGGHRGVPQQNGNSARVACRFPVAVVQEIIKGVLRAKLTDAKYSGELGKEIADAVKVEVRGA
jgi:hypothetical protein